jgi:hypothetical protein
MHSTAHNIHDNKEGYAFKENGRFNEKALGKKGAVNGYMGIFV